MIAERLLTMTIAQGFDRLVGEPPGALHPVVGIGALATTMERLAPDTAPVAQLAYGAALVGVVVGTAPIIATLAEAILAQLPPEPRILLRALLLKPTFAARELLAAAERVRFPLETGDLDVARTALRDLVSRDPRTLDEGLVASTVVESLAENASDSIVAPWLAFLVSGLPGAYANRAVNTLDAMVGCHGHEYLGRPAARLDHLLNLVPARLTAVLLIAGATCDGRVQAAWRATLRDHSAPASPNAGWPMVAMAGALQVRLEKIDYYVLGSGYRLPGAADIAAANRLVSRLATMAGCALALVGPGSVRLRRRKDSA